MANLWVDKYKPTSLEEIIGNTAKIKLIDNWMNNFKNIDSKKILLLTGPPGIGKTTLANLILQKYNYSIIEFNSSSIRGPKNIKEMFDNILNNNNVIFKNTTGIIMDEIDTLCNGGDKGGMTEFLNIIKSRKKKNIFNINNPIICTYNDFSDKKIKELINFSLEIKLNKPTENDIIYVIDRIVKNEGMSIEMDAKIFLAKHCNGDIRKVIGYLYELYLIYKDQTIDYNNIEDFKKVYIKKDVDIKIFDMVYNLFNKSINENDIINYYETDKLLLPMMIHENYINSINNRNISNNLKKKYILEDADILIKNDIYQTSNYENQSWDSIDIMAFVYCLKFNEISKMNKLLSTYDKINYTMLLNNVSNYHKNKKMINTLCTKMNINMSFEDLNFLSEIIVYHLFHKNGNRDELINIMNKYNISIENIDLLLKINKLNNTEIKKKYTSKIKNEIKAKLNNSQLNNITDNDHNDSDTSDHSDNDS